MLKIILNNIEGLAKVTAAILKLDFKKPWIVEIKQFREKRSLSQNALQWDLLTAMQNTRINEHAGTTKEEWHEIMKGRFLVTIFERDNPDYALMIENVRGVYKAGLKEEALNMRKDIVKLTSTRDCSVKQMTEYLECIMHWCNQRGIAYRLKSDVR